jgi:hypothetical protein
VFPLRERWLGALGLKNSGYETWSSHNGITQTNYSEAQYHFSSESEAANFFKNGGYEEGTYVYRHDGLAMYYEKVKFKGKGNGGVLQLMLCQFMINGQKPKNLLGSQDDMISVEYNIKP